MSEENNSITENISKYTKNRNRADLATYFFGGAGATALIIDNIQLAGVWFMGYMISRALESSYQSKVNNLLSRLDE